ncbi:MAG: sugar ABC transporter permease [Candidatus Hydrogenedentes bacterium]|nr:sugar ABC transporter permease [Candidatus Hydrogenedentota bacterium]
MHIHELTGRCDRAVSWMAGGPARGEAIAAFILLAPALLILIAFTAVPFLGAIALSLQQGRYDALTYVGLKNYADVLTNGDFWNSVLVTFYYLIGVVPATLLLGFFAAYALHRVTRFQHFLRTLYFLPYITPIVAAAMIWRALLNTELGLVNHLFETMGWAPQQWLLEARGLLHLLLPDRFAPGFGPSLSLCCVMIFDVWHNTGFVVVLFLAGFTALPRELEEAARIDGAGTVALIRHVYLPLLAPIIVFLLIVGTAGAFQAFNSFYALTYGGNQTLGSTDNLMLYLYRSFYEYGRWGYGSTVAVILSAFIAALSWIQWRAARNRVYAA